MAVRSRVRCFAPNEMVIVNVQRSVTASSNLGRVRAAEDNQAIGSCLSLRSMHTRQRLRLSGIDSELAGSKGMTDIDILQCSNSGERPTVLLRFWKTVMNFNPAGFGNAPLLFLSFVVVDAPPSILNRK